jgi:glucose-fructose oxidoreductase
MSAMKKPDRQVRYAVVGQGWFAQEAVLPAFANARKNSALAAIVSGDPVKRDELGQLYGVPAHSYEDYDALLARGDIDAVYIVLPNSMHCDYTLRAAKAGAHVLCEKPMAADSDECRRMIAACEQAKVKLMVAYRLHFEEGNLEAVELLKSGKLGDPRSFVSAYTQQVKEGNTRLDADLAGSPLMDIGIYCINAARYLFQDDPVEVTGFAASTGESRFREVPEMVAAMMRFPKERLASFLCGFGEAKVSNYQVMGTRGDLRMDPAYSFNADLRLAVTVEGETSQTKYRKRDQVGAEIVYFSDCVLNNREPEPNGLEGLADLLIIEAIERSTTSGKAVKLDPFQSKPRPSKEQMIHLSPVSPPELVNAEAPGRG